MKKYTQPQVEITAFDFEDITMSSNPTAKDAYIADKTNAIVVPAPAAVEW